MARLVVTRPEPQAQKTIEALIARGHQVTHVPLTEIRPLDHTSDLPKKVDALIATSANALKFAKPELIAQCADKAIYCVGSKTAKLAGTLGLDVQVCCETAEELMRAIVSEPLQSFAYLCSKHRMSTLDDRLPPKQLHIIETYEAPFIDPNMDTSTIVDGVLLYSVRAAQSWAKSGIQAQFHFCMSENIANCLPESQRQTVKIATKPLEAQLFSEIDKIFTPN